MNKSNYSDQTKRRARREAVIISIFAFLGIFAKFAYIFFKTEKEGAEPVNLFGYQYLSQFSWAFGNEVFTLSLGVLLFISTRFFYNTYSPVKLVFRAAAFVIMSIGFYFMGWIFSQDFYSNRVEVVMAIIFSAITTALFIPFLMYLTREITNVKELKASFIDFLVSIIPQYKKMTKHALKPNLYHDAEQEVFDEIKNDSDTFQKTLYNKTDELID